MFSKTLEEHLRHLNIIVKLLISLNIVLMKMFFSFLSTTLLDQKVNFFNMTAVNVYRHEVLKS